ncbi:MAG: hypothetical protein ACRD2N_24995, partial [Vicinamibacterales bacterium]
AEALLLLGIVELPGNAGQALQRAQQDYVVSLRAFPDDAATHLELGWYEAQRGNIGAAERALSDALRVDPNRARAWVVRGVLAARAARYAEAIGFWKQAKAIDAAYPNIDQLIAEAERRKQKH